MEKWVKKEIIKLRANQKICNENSQELERQIKDIPSKLVAYKNYVKSCKSWETNKKADYERVLAEYNTVKETKEFAKLKKILESIASYEGKKDYVINAETIHTDRLVFEYNLEIKKLVKEINTKYLKEYAILLAYEEKLEGKKEYDKNLGIAAELKDNIISDLKELVSLHSYVENIDVEIQELLNAKTEEIVSKFENVKLSCKVVPYDQKAYGKLIQLSKKIGLITENQVKELEDSYKDSSIIIEKIYDNRLNSVVLKPKITFGYYDIYLDFWPKVVFDTLTRYVGIPQSNIKGADLIKSVRGFRENHPYIKVQTMKYDNDTNKVITDTAYFDVMGNKYSEMPDKNKLMLGEYVLGKYTFNDLPKSLFADKIVCAFIEKCETKKYLLRNAISQKLFISKEDKNNIAEIKNAVKEKYLASKNQAHEQEAKSR